MARPKLPPNARLGTPVYVLLIPAHRALLNRIAHREKRSRGEVLRGAFLEKYSPLIKPRGAHQ